MRSSIHASRIGICFDLDGVLIHTMPFHATAWQAAMRRFGLSVSRREIYQWEGEPGTVTARKLLARSQGRVPTTRTCAALLEEKERRFTRRTLRVRIDPMWPRLLRRLRHRGFRLALVTGTSADEVTQLVPAGIRRLFHVIVTGDALRHGKPHPMPYQIACRRLHVPPRRAIVIENAPFGIQSARRTGVGLIVALASSLPRRYLQDADLITPSPQVIRHLLEERLTPFSSVR